MGIFNDIYNNVNDTSTLCVVLHNSTIVEDSKEIFKYENLNEGDILNSGGSSYSGEYSLRATSHTYERQDRDNNIVNTSNAMKLNHITREEILNVMIEGCRDIWQGRKSISRIRGTLENDIERTSIYCQSLKIDSPTDNKKSGGAYKYKKKQNAKKQDALDTEIQNKKEEYHSAKNKVARMENEYENYGSALPDDYETLKDLVTTYEEEQEELNSAGDTKVSNSTKKTHRELRCSDTFAINDIGTNLWIIVQYQNDDYTKNTNYTIPENTHEFVAITCLRVEDWGGNLSKTNGTIEVMVTPQESWSWWDSQTQSEIDAGDGKVGEYRNIGRNKKDLMEVVVDKSFYRKDGFIKPKNDGSGVDKVD